MKSEAWYILFLCAIPEWATLNSTHMILLPWWWTAKNLLIVYQSNAEISPKDMTGILATSANICRARYIVVWLECLELHDKLVSSQRGSATSWQKDKWVFSLDLSRIFPILFSGEVNSGLDASVTKKQQSRLLVFQGLAVFFIRYSVPCVFSTSLFCSKYWQISVWDAQSVMPWWCVCWFLSV